ncbi:MAG: hypothetical protein KAT37_03565 [Candidatus Aenigmarchaeota archaeon]|nr:hypothetical protein [Candidatus Aenigmarchaeota archaeon]
MKRKNIGQKGGWIIEVFVLFLIIGLMVGFFIFFQLQARSNAILEMNIETRVEAPSVSEISSNAFLISEHTYPDDSSKMRNIISMYNNSDDDAALKSIIQNKKDEMFAVVPSKVMLVIGDYTFDGGYVGDRDTAFRKVAIPEGKSEKIQLRFYV